jgi:hypothetical protein
MNITQNTKISIGALVVVVPLVVSGVWGYEAHRDSEMQTAHAAMALAAEEARMEVQQMSYAASRDTELELIDAKLKMYRMLREHRELTEDELADEEWLKERKRILLEEQRERRG